MYKLHAQIGDGPKIVVEYPSFDALAVGLAGMCEWVSCFTPAVTATVLGPDDELLRTVVKP